MTDTARRERRNTTYSRQVGDDICDLIVDGKTPQEICDGEDGRPTHFSTLYRWLESEPEFNRCYSAAWLWRVDHMARELVGIADDDSGDHESRKKGTDGPETMVFVRENVMRSKLRIETRWRVLASFFPQRYACTLMGGAAPQPTPNGDDAKVIEAKTIQDEVKTFTQDQLRDEALNWAPSKT